MSRVPDCCGRSRRWFPCSGAAMWTDFVPRGLGPARFGRRAPRPRYDSSRRVRWRNEHSTSSVEWPGVGPPLEVTRTRSAPDPTCSVWWPQARNAAVVAQPPQAGAQTGVRDEAVEAASVRSRGPVHEQQELSVGELVQLGGRHTRPDQRCSAIASGRHRDPGRRGGSGGAPTSRLRVHNLRPPRP